MYTSYVQGLLVSVLQGRYFGMISKLFFSRVYENPGQSIGAPMVQVQSMRNKALFLWNKDA